jgi:SAM-dependent methyltransferase
MSKLEQYAKNQFTQYEQSSQSLEEARRQVAPDYGEVAAVAPHFCHLVLSHYFQRQGRHYRPGETDLSAISVLDVGCGVGRVMEAFKEIGVGRVDGCDISPAMLSHAAASPKLAGSRFFQTSGHDTGGAPADSYDIACSFLCFHHIPMRQTRIRMLEAMSLNLKPEGLCFIELKIFPGATPAKIPMNHAHWSENTVSRFTNSAADVWVTPDALGLVYEDFRLFYNDVGMLEMDTGADLYEYHPDAVYQLGFNELYVFGSRGGHAKWRLTQGLA